MTPVSGGTKSDLEFSKLEVKDGVLYINLTNRGPADIANAHITVLCDGTTPTMMYVSMIFYEDDAFSLAANQSTADIAVLKDIKKPYSFDCSLQWADDTYITNNSRSIKYP